MEMHQVRYFLAVSRTLNFTRAAEECNVSQPSLTKAVQKLEEELGGLLFRRERGLTHLTDLGRLMLPHLEQTFSAAQNARSLAAGLKRADVAPLTLGVADTVFLAGLPSLLQELARALKGLQLAVRYGPQDILIESALHGDVDILIVAETPDLTDRLRLRRLYSQAALLLLPETALAELILPAAADSLTGRPWVERTGCPQAAAFLADCQVRGTAPAVQHRADSDIALQQLIQAGLGWSLGWEGGPRLPGIAAIPLDGSSAPGRQLALATVTGRQYSTAADSFVRLARSRDWSGDGSPRAA